MANIHVNSTTGGTPASPYVNWADAATTLAAAAAVAVAGDTVYVHPSHNETTGATCVWAGTTTNPVRIICGTPDTVSGITALQNTAIWGIAASGSSASWTGSTYCHGIIFKLIGNSGSAIVTLSSSSDAITTFNQCSFQYGGTNGTMRFGPGVTAGGICQLLSCSFRFGAAGHTFLLQNRMYGTDLSVVSGSVTPTVMFALGSSTFDNGPIIEIDGFDFSNLANTVKVVSTFAALGLARLRNVKVPAGWGVAGGTVATGELTVGAQLEILNYGDGDTNYRYWIENKQGRALSESTIKMSGADASGNSTGTYSRRMQTLATVVYPNSIFRGPPISKYVVANGQYKGIFVHIVHDGSLQFTDKEFWIEVSFRGTTDSPVTTTLSSCPSFLTNAVALYSSVELWDGDTGTGPNGTSNWNTLYAYKGSIPLLEDGWITVTPCMSIASKTLFMNDSFVVEDEGAI